MPVFSDLPIDKTLHKPTGDRDRRVRSSPRESVRSFPTSLRVRAAILT